MTLKILLAEDEVQLSRVYTAALTHQGYHVDQAYNGQEALDFSQKNAYDLMILDIMMPIKTGLEALREIRLRGDKTHVIMLTAMSEIDDRVTGLDAGADDYLTKPISLKELLARLRSMERRFDHYSEKRLSFGKVSLDMPQQELRAKNSIRLSGKEALLMAFLMQNATKSLSTQELFHYVWGKDKDSDMDEGYVYIYISYLRQKLKAVQAEVAIIGDENQSFQLVQLEGKRDVS